jgi:hypothetical protein
MHPYLESAPDRYCRLFAPSAPADNGILSDLKDLGCAMTDDGSRVSPNRPEILVDVGYTYFGQFVDHDLTKDTSSLETAAKTEPKDLENFQTPQLDLSHLYGDGPEGKLKALYQPDGVKFKVGDVGPKGRSFDVYIDPISQKPLLADGRSGENVILRQIAAVFARLHNSIADQLQKRIAGSRQRFKAAQLRTTWHLQWLVVGDFLESVLDLDVLAKVRNKSTVEWDTFSIPIEFAVAAFRFGHSMVRTNYRLSLEQEDFPLVRLFGLRDDVGALSDKVEIQWGLFFQGAGEGGAITSRPIDARISDSLHKLPDELIRLFNVASPSRTFLGDPPQLPVRTLLRGARLKLPSGQTVAKAFGIRPLSPEELTTKWNGEETDAGKILKRRNEWLSDTPLWYYILKESEVIHNGSRLGPTGSYIVAETIYGALRKDPDSYFNHLEAKGAPPNWPFPDGVRPLYGLSELFRLASELGT